MTLIDIITRLKDDKCKHDDEVVEPIKCITYKVPSFYKPVCTDAKGARPKWIKKLSQMLAFIKSIQYKLDDSWRSEIPISTRDSTNLAIWGSRTSVSTHIKEMIDIGLLTLHSSEARFGRADTRSCYTYYYYKDNGHKFIKFCNDNNIKPFDIMHSEKTVQPQKTVERIVLPTFKRTNVVFGSNKRFTKPKDSTREQFKAFLEECLFENYSQLRYYQKIVEEINKLCPIDKPELLIKLKPHFTWSTSGKSVTKIGIRAASKLNNTSKKERDALLRYYHFDMKHDVRSSIPRVLYSLQQGEWLSENIDLYKEIYKNCGYDDELTAEMREAIKALFMRAYFDTKGRMVNNIWNNMEQDGISKKDVAEQMMKLRNAIEQTCGNKLQGTEAFLAESCVYLRVFKRLLEEGRKGWLLYDCFYCTSINGEDEATFSQKIEQYLRESLKEYISIVD